MNDTKTNECRHCRKTIVYENGVWIDPNDGGNNTVCMWPTHNRQIAFTDHTPHRLASMSDCHIMCQDILHNAARHGTSITKSHAEYVRVFDLHPDIAVFLWQALTDPDQTFIDPEGCQ